MSRILPPTSLQALPSQRSAAPDARGLLPSVEWSQLPPCRVRVQISGAAPDGRPEGLVCSRKRPAVLPVLQPRAVSVQSGFPAARGSAAMGPSTGGARNQLGALADGCCAEVFWESGGLGTVPQDTACPGGCGDRVSTGTTGTGAAHAGCPSAGPSPVLMGYVLYCHVDTCVYICAPVHVCSPPAPNHSTSAATFTRPGGSRGRAVSGALCSLHSAGQPCEILRGMPRHTWGSEPSSSVCNTLSF